MAEATNKALEGVSLLCRRLRMGKSNIYALDAMAWCLWANLMWWHGRRKAFSGKKLGSVIAGIGTRAAGTLMGGIDSF